MHVRVLHCRQPCMIVRGSLFSACVLPGKAPLRSFQLCFILSLIHATPKPLLDFTFHLSGLHSALALRGHSGSYRIFSIMPSVMPTLPAWSLSGPLDCKPPEGKASLEPVTVPASGLVPIAWNIIGLGTNVSGVGRRKQLAPEAGRRPGVQRSLGFLSQIILS